MTAMDEQTLAKQPGGVIDGVIDGATLSPVAPIADYYDDTVIDYNAWSKEGYLHFGYWRPWLNPFSRRPMLEEMNRLIFKHFMKRMGYPLS